MTIDELISQLTSGSVPSTISLEKNEYTSPYGGTSVSRYPVDKVQQLIDLIKVQSTVTSFELTLDSIPTECMPALLTIRNKTIKITLVERADFNGPYQALCKGVVRISFLDTTAY